MKTLAITVTLVLMFVVTMSAGVVTGRLTSRPPNAGAARNGSAAGSPLSKELQLTPDQAAQMRLIWEAARDAARAAAADADRIQREHEDQLAAMLTDEQKAKYEQLSQANHRRIAALDVRRRESFRRAVDQTHQVLREDQWRVYEQIIHNQLGSVSTGGDPAAPAPQKSASE